MQFTKIRMSGGDAIIRAAVANGMQTIFGLPGAQIYPLFDALHRSGTQLIVPRHEQAAAYMAMGYAKSTGTTGVFTVVPGPGVLNTAAALCTAMGNCSPLVCLTGQVPSQFLGKRRGHLHELADQPATLGSIIKDAVRIVDPVDTSRIVNRAFRTARSGRPGPVSVEMCWDTMAADTDVLIEDGAEGCDQPEPDLDAINEAVAVLRSARKPMIMCGAGAQHAADEVRALATLLNAPVTAFRSGRGVVPEDHPLGVAAVTARELWDDVDVLIGIGSRLEMPFIRWQNPLRYDAGPAVGRRVIRIDIDADEMLRFRPTVGVVADAAVACRLLVDKLKGYTPDRERRTEIATAKATAQHLLQTIQPQMAYLEVIRRALPRDGFLVPELSQVGFATYTGAFPVLGPRTYVSEGFQGTLGFGFPTALGVKVAHPDKAVISITGDGGLLFGIQELATAAQYRIAVVTLVFNNNSYGNVLRDQQQQFGGRAVGSRLVNPDFVRLAESFDVAAYRVHSPKQLEPVLMQAIEAQTPALIEVVVDEGSETSPWPFIHMPARPSAVVAR
jgi:acetolactate synthase-1/2/3 large subunit